MFSNLDNNDVLTKNWINKIIHANNIMTHSHIVRVVDNNGKLNCSSIVVLKCKCGREYTLKLGSLRNSKFNPDKKCRSCAKAGSIFVGDKGTKFHKIAQCFGDMHKRCNGDYAKRGITVSPEWSHDPEGYQNYKNWFIGELDKLDISIDDFNSYHNHELSVDRINNNDNYCPSNCRIATRKQQNRNKSRSRKFYGKHILDYADELGIPYKLAYDYYHRNEFGKLLDYYNYDNSFEVGNAKE